MKIETHNKKFSYEINNTNNRIVYNSEISKEGGYDSIVIARDIHSAVITPDDKFLYLLSVINRIIYIYFINQLSGCLLQPPPPQYSMYIAGNNSHLLKISKSGFYLCAYGEPIPLVFSINQKDGSLTLFTKEFGLKILNEEIF